MEHSYEVPKKGLDYGSVPDMDKFTDLGSVVEYFIDDMPGKVLSLHDNNSGVTVWADINRAALIEENVLVDTTRPNGRRVVMTFDSKARFSAGYREPGDLWFRDEAWNHKHPDKNGDVNVSFCIYDEPQEGVFFY
jgi:hypothetical protein